MLTQYREKGFRIYFELISCLLVVEENNELLMKNHESHLTSSNSFLKMNVISYNRKDKAHANNRSRGHGRNHGRDRGCG